jgi:5-methylthioribose kinase
VIAARHPDLAEVIERCVDVMMRAGACLVHGDYTPKNVLADPADAGVWVIDWEVAHVGDPTFDPAWMVGHLLLKTVHRPAAAARYADAARAFLAAWRAELAGAAAIDRAQLTRQAGCLLLARVDGTSPAEYLTAAEKVQVRGLARRLLTDPPPEITDAWELTG